MPWPINSRPAISCLDRRSKRVSRSNRDINLSPTEFRLLEQLMRNPGRVYSRAQLLDTVWGRDALMSMNAPLTSMSVACANH